MRLLNDQSLAEGPLPLSAAARHRGVTARGPRDQQRLFAGLFNTTERLLGLLLAAGRPRRRRQQLTGHTASQDSQSLLVAGGSGAPPLLPRIGLHGGAGR